MAGTWNTWGDAGTQIAGFIFWRFIILPFYWMEFQ